MRFTNIVLAGSAALVLAGCAGGGPFQRQRPDEFAVARNAPLVVPPDFALTPPAPGAARPGNETTAEQMLKALFGGDAQRIAAETQVIGKADGDVERKAGGLIVPSAVFTRPDQMEGPPALYTALIGMVAKLRAAGFSFGDTAQA